MQLEPCPELTPVPALAREAVGASALGIPSWQNLGGTQGPNPGSSVGRTVGHFLLVNSAFSPSRECGAWDNGVGTGWERGAAGKMTQLFSFAKTFTDKLA